MMAEIYARGPIACGVAVDQAFEDYDGGIFEGPSGGGINHEISIAGWGTDAQTGEKYWVLRNSWVRLFMTVAFCVCMACTLIPRT
jgi:cathepsin X